MWDTVEYVGQVLKQQISWEANHPAYASRVDALHLQKMTELADRGVLHLRGEYKAGLSKAEARMPGAKRKLEGYL